MNLGEFRRKTADLPDDSDIFADGGALEMSETCVRRILPPVLEHSYAIIIDLSQVINYEFDLDVRIDAQLGDY